MVYKKSIWEYLFDICNILLLLLLALACLYPMMYVIFASLSEPAELSKSAGILLYPKGLQFNTYKVVFKNSDIVVGYANTLLYVVVGTLLNMLLTVLGAYVLSRKSFHYRRILMFYITFTMFVGGGLVPSYLLVKNIGILNTRLAVLLPSAISAYNLILTRTYFNTIPDALEGLCQVIVGYF